MQMDLLCWCKLVLQLPQELIQQRIRRLQGLQHSDMEIEINLHLHVDGGFFKAGPPGTLPTGVSVGNISPQDHGVLVAPMTRQSLITPPAQA